MTTEPCYTSRTQLIIIIHGFPFVQKTTLVKPGIQLSGRARGTEFHLQYREREDRRERHTKTELFESTNCLLIFIPSVPNSQKAVLMNV